MSTLTYLSLPTTTHFPAHLRVAYAYDLALMAVVVVVAVAVVRYVTAAAKAVVDLVERRMTEVHIQKLNLSNMVSSMDLKTATVA